MRKPFVAGNWKMNKTVEQARQLVAELLPGMQAAPSVEQVLCARAIVRQLQCVEPFGLVCRVAATMAATLFSS